MSFFKDVVIICLGYCWHSRKFTQIQQLQIGRRHVKSSVKSVSPHGHPSTSILVGWSGNQHWWCIFKLLIMVIMSLVIHMVYLESSHVSCNPGMFTLHVCLESSATLFIFQEMYKSTCLNLYSYKRLTWGLWNFAHQQQQKRITTFNTILRTNYKN